MSYRKLYNLYNIYKQKLISLLLSFIRLFYYYNIILKTNLTLKPELFIIFLE